MDKGSYELTWLNPLRGWGVVMSNESPPKCYLMVPPDFEPVEIEDRCEDISLEELGYKKQTDGNRFKESDDVWKNIASTIQKRWHKELSNAHPNGIEGKLIHALGELDVSSIDISANYEELSDTVEKLLTIFNINETGTKKIKQAIKQLYDTSPKVQRHLQIQNSVSGLDAK